MRNVAVTFESVTAYSQSRQHETPKLSGETNDAYESRTWREKSNCDDREELFIPGMGMKQALDSASKKSGLQIPGKGKSTYAKFFLADCICDGNIKLGVFKEDVGMVRISANVDGVRGSGKRVWKNFPVVNAWTAVGYFSILDDTITREVFEAMMKIAGASIGIGRFRPEKGGLNGRFRPTEFAWS
jgi:hypothetical protein